MYIFEILHLSWAMRRKCDPEKEIIDVHVKHFKKEKFCMVDMEVTFANHEPVQEVVKGKIGNYTKVLLTGQVGYNSIKEYWYVNGIDRHGNQAAVKVVELLECPGEAHFLDGTFNPSSQGPYGRGYHDCDLCDGEEVVTQEVYDKWECDEVVKKLKTGIRTNTLA